MGKKKTKREARRLLAHRGNLSYIFHSGQKKINEVFKKAIGAVIVFLISRQWGKTVFAATKCCELATKKKKAKIRYATAFETDLLEFAIPAFEFVIEQMPKELRPRFIEHKKKYIFPNGAEIKLVGLDRKPNGLRGNAIDLIVLDEAGFMNRLNYLHTSVIVPLTTHRPEAKILIISTPPESPDHEFWDFVDRAKLEGSFALFTIDDIPLLTRLDIERIEREMGGRETTAFQREYLCKRIVEASRAIVPEWNSALYVADPVRDEYWPWYQRVEAMDIGIRRDFTVVLFGTYAFRPAKFYLHDLIVMTGPKMTTDLLAKAIQEKEFELWGNSEKPDDKIAVHHRIADNSHPLLNNDLTLDYQIPFEEVEKGSLDEMVNDLRLWVKSGRLIVSPKAKHLIGALESGIWNEKRSEFSQSKNFGHFDAVAAAVYLVRCLKNGIEQYNPIPENALKNPYTHFILPEAKMSRTAKELKRAFTR